jgi:hypothetical protein
MITVLKFFTLQKYKINGCLLMQGKKINGETFHAGDGIYYRQFSDVNRFLIVQYFTVKNPDVFAIAKYCTIKNPDNLPSRNIARLRIRTCLPSRNIARLRIRPI